MIGDGDMGVFFSDDFAVSVKLVFKDNRLRPRTIKAVFDEPYVDADLGEYVLDTVQPRITAAWSDVKDCKKFDFAIVHGKRYVLSHNAQSDGTGVGMLAMTTDTNV